MIVSCDLSRAVRLMNHRPFAVMRAAARRERLPSSRRAPRLRPRGAQRAALVAWDGRRPDVTAGAAPATNLTRTGFGRSGGNDRASRS